MILQLTFQVQSKRVDLLLVYFIVSLRKATKRHPTVVAKTNYSYVFLAIQTIGYIFIQSIGYINVRRIQIIKVAQLLDFYFIYLNDGIQQYKLM